MLRVLHRTRRKNEGKNMGRYLELSEIRETFSRKKRRGKRAVRKAACMKHKAARARSRLDELTFGTFNVRTAAVTQLPNNCRSPLFFCLLFFLGRYRTSFSE